jgi:hypothetical protein
MKCIIEYFLNAATILGILVIIAGEVALIGFIIRNIFFLPKIEFCYYIPFVSISLSIDGGNTYHGLFSKIPIEHPFYLRYEVSVMVKGLFKRN